MKVAGHANASCAFSDPTLVNPTVTCNDNGTFTLTLSVSDGIAPAVTSHATLTVNNVAPTVSAITGLPTDPIPANYQVTACVTFTDPAGAQDVPYTASFDWSFNGGGLLTPPVNDHPQACSQYAYTQAGLYAVRVGVTDKDGGTGYSPVYEYVIVYDPSAGFVTGGGWFDTGGCVSRESVPDR